jgi:hypothetical protein
VTVIGGLLTSTLLTLVLIPAIYTIMDDLQNLIVRVYRHFRPLVPDDEPEAGPVVSVPNRRPQPQLSRPVPTISGGSD